MDVWMSLTFRLLLHVLTESRPDGSAHFPLTDVGILPSVWSASETTKAGVELHQPSTLPLGFLSTKL